MTVPGWSSYVAGSRAGHRFRSYFRGRVGVGPLVGWRGICRERDIRRLFPGRPVSSGEDRSEFGVGSVPALVLCRDGREGTGTVAEGCRNAGRSKCAA